MSVVIVGSMAFDTIETPFDKREKVLGGACVYASIAASYFDRPYIVGVVGDDFTDAQFKLLHDKKIDTLGVKKEKGKSFFWAGRYNADMKTRETITTELNVFEHFNPEIPEKYSAMPYLFLANIDPALQLKVLNSMKKLKFSMCDTMNLWISIKKPELTEVFKRVNCVVLNDEEIAQYTGKTDIVSGAKDIMKLGPQYIIIKKGEHGAVLIGKNLYFNLPAYPVAKASDPTGAGDTFGGAFIGYLAGRNDTGVSAMKKAIAYGNTAASFTVEDFGVDRINGVSRKEIDARMNQLKKMVTF